MATPATIPYTLTVVSGTGSGTCPQLVVMNIAAHTPPSGKQFAQCTGCATKYDNQDGSERIRIFFSTAGCESFILTMP